MTLTEFLLTRIAEDEAVARYEDGDLTDRPDIYPALGGADPQRVLAECEAKRRIVEMCDADAVCVEHYLRRIPDCRECFAAEQVSVVDRNVLSILTLPYADHSDYREEWCPLVLG